MNESPSDLPRTLARALTSLEASFGRDFFTTRQAADLRVGSLALHRLAVAGELATVVQGVHRCGRALTETSVQDRARALALVLPEGGAVARGTAAWLLGVDPRSPAERFEPVAIECLVARDRQPIHRAGIRCYQSDLPGADLIVLDGVPCTSPERTAADLLRWAPPHMGLAIVDALVGRWGIPMSEIHDCLSRWPGDRNVRQARRLAGWIDPLSESFGESWLRLRILEAGFPRPTAQIPVPDESGRVRYRLDLGWPERKLGVEYDGLEHHSGPAAFRADQRRRDELAARFGWSVVGVGLGEVLGGSLRLERGIGELLGLEPTIGRRRW